MSLNSTPFMGRRKDRVTSLKDAIGHNESERSPTEGMKSQINEEHSHQLDCFPLEWKG